MQDSHNPVSTGNSREIVHPPIDRMLARVDSRFTLCTLAAKRSRQITDMINGALGDRGALSDFSAGQIPMLTSTKPLTLALNEVVDGDVSPAEENVPAVAEASPETDSLG